MNAILLFPHHNIFRILKNIFCYFRIFKWGDTYNIYSFLKVWIVFDGSFAEVIPAPSVKGQHCGLCGTYNRNKYDEWTKKDGKALADSAASMVQEYKWN